LRLLEAVERTAGLPVTTRTFNLPGRAAAAAEVCSLLPDPGAFSRPTNATCSSARQRKPSWRWNVKKGQFIGRVTMRIVVDKLRGSFPKTDENHGGRTEGRVLGL